MLLMAGTGLLHRLVWLPPVLELALFDRIDNLGFFLLIVAVLAFTGVTVRSSICPGSAAALAAAALVFRVFMHTCCDTTLSIGDALAEAAVPFLWGATA
jgi:hypothetical protein